MSLELTERMNAQENMQNKETLYLLGGVAMVVFGAGLILTAPAIRNLLGGARLGNLLQAAVPDLERYMKLRAM